MSFILRRVAILPEGAFGVLLHNGVPFAVTCERTYSLRQESVIFSPAAVEQAETQGLLEYPKIAGSRSYRCKQTVYNKRPTDAPDRHTYEIEVPGHTRILFHIGNWETDSEGCVLVGESLVELNGRPAIGQSGQGFAEFMRRANGAPEFTLTVYDPA